jgi:hypothetical protein
MMGLRTNFDVSSAVVITNCYYVKNQRISRTAAVLLF